MSGPRPKPPWSLQWRLGVAVGALVTVLWAAGAVLTADRLRHKMDQVFDASLQETAQRILPFAVSEILDRDDMVTGTQTVPAVRAHDEVLIYVVRDAKGQVLMLSHQADPADFPAYDGPGFHTTADLRLYNDEALRGSVTISVAEPLVHRKRMAFEVQMGLLAPLALVLPLSLLGIAGLMRLGFAPLRRFRARLAKRGAADLAPVATGDLPAEVQPLAQTLNALLDRLDAAFQAERSFAANAAHELRTPLAGAIAQVQRLRVETTEPAIAARATEIETVLKRLTRLSEGLMSLARAEGGKLRRDAAQDLRPVLRLVAQDAARLAGGAGGAGVDLDLPEAPLLSDLDPDLFGILARNLIANALHHGSGQAPVRVALRGSGLLRVENDCAPVPPEVLSRLAGRFERAPGTVCDGAGLGLAIARAILDRAGGTLVLTSPLPGQTRGFAAEAAFPPGQPG
ncbi:two-component sensor histidine kinase [Rhodobacter sp. Har01]|uniref:ATP-binding protein n=1 Tax=Rhodobacter sp. Har01 TaxID=2883999 RepID=UPI001D083756|nr:ATP-binding protein [Rhodobacter sp. Har01]MCB6176622.1 two-component sensor histidine kinase [Rhodobacter sp. Har01]